MRKTGGAAGTILEFELLDTGLFDDNRYWDVEIEYAKAGPQDTLLQITLHNRGPDTAEIHVLPQLFFRNTWAWGYDVPKPTLYGHRRAAPSSPVIMSWASTNFTAIAATTLLFCDNETNTRKLFGSHKDRLFQGWLPRSRSTRKSGGGESAPDRHQGSSALRRQSGRRARRAWFVFA